MLPKKVLDLREFAGLPNYLVFSNEDKILKPYSSWDSVNNSKRLVETNTYRRYDVVCSSHHVRDRFLDAIDRMGCVKAKYVLDTASCVVHVLDVIDSARFSECCRVAPLATDDYILVIHEVAGAYQILSGKGVEVFGYLTEALTYVRR